MIVIKVYGVPDEYPQDKLKDFMKALKCESNDMKLVLQDHQATVFFPRDIIQKGLGEEIIIYVDHLLVEDDFHLIQSRYAESLVRISKDFFPKAFIECFVQDFDDKKDMSCSSIDCV